MAYNPIFSLGGAGFGGRPATGSGFNLNPRPQGGSGAYGSVPGAIGMPTSRYSQIGGILPGQAARGRQIATNLDLDLSGDIDYETLQNDAARFGITSGMPGSNFGDVRLLNRSDTERRNIRRQGLQDYLAANQGIGALMDDPNLAASLATQNAVWASAPNPQAAAEAQMARWQEQFDKLASAGGGGGSGRPWAGAQTATVRGGPAGGTSSWDEFADARNSGAQYGVAQAYSNPSLNFPGAPGGGVDPSFQVNDFWDPFSGGSNQLGANDPDNYDPYDFG